MIDFIATSKMTDRSVIASCLLGARSDARRPDTTCIEATRFEATRFDAAGVSGLGLSESGVLLGGGERPAEAPVVAAQAHAYARARVANGAGIGRKRTQNHTWAFRGLEPWRDPA